MRWIGIGRLIVLCDFAVSSTGQSDACGAFLYRYICGVLCKEIPESICGASLHPFNKETILSRFCDPSTYSRFVLSLVRFVAYPCAHLLHIQDEVSWQTKPNAVLEKVFTSISKVLPSSGIERNRTSQKRHFYTLEICSTCVELFFYMSGDVALRWCAFARLHFICFTFLLHPYVEYQSKVTHFFSRFYIVHTIRLCEGYLTRKVGYWSAITTP